MPQFNVDIWWSVKGHAVIDAESEDDAVEHADTLSVDDPEVVIDQACITDIETRVANKNGGEK